MDEVAQRLTTSRRLLMWLVAAWLIVSGAVVLANGKSDAEANLPKGIGPIQELELEPIDDDMAEAGRVLFEANCAACHKFDERYVGPALAGVTERRSPEWIMNLILNTDQMLFEDDTAYELLAEYMTPMSQLPLSEEEVRSILEYFREVDHEAQEHDDSH